MPVVRMLYQTGGQYHVPSLFQIITQVFQSAADTVGSVNISLMVESADFGQGRLSPAPGAVELGGNQWWRALSKLFLVTQEPN
jgi:hypothetical protein